MDGVHPLLCGVLNGGSVCCCPAPTCGMLPVCAPPCLVHGVSTAVVSCCCLVAMSCGVGGVCLSVVLCGGVSLVRLPLAVVEGVAVVDGGVA